MRFADAAKGAGPDLVVSPRHESWLSGSDRPEYSPRALKFAGQQLRDLGRERKGTVSASSLGECQRYQQFVYIGMPKLQPSTQNLSRMMNGTFMHLRWQLAGLSEGWLRQAEVPVKSEEHRLMGTMDGLLYDGAVLELKSINSNGFSRVMAFGPLIPHLFQMATYMLCTGRDKGVFIYENKDNQEYIEKVVTRAEVPTLEAAGQAKTLWAAVEGKTLFEPLEKCLDHTGYRYTSCPFRDRCLTIYTWDEALAHA